jgi:hypothetical protein
VSEADVILQAVNMFMNTLQTLGLAYIAVLARRAV